MILSEAQHLERELVQSPVQDSQFQDWPKATTFLGYDEVRAVKPLPHLGWRDRLDCILCQEDSNLLAKDRGIPDCHLCLENAVELGRLPGELNHVAESNCAREPARQAGGWCITPGQDVLDRLGLLLYRRELLGEALDGVAEQPCLGDGGVEKACFVGVLHLCQVEPEMVLLDHHGGHRLPEGPHRDFCRS